MPDRLSRLYPDEVTDAAKEIKIWAIAPIETFQGATVDSELTPPHTKEILMARAHQEGHFGALAMQKILLVAGHKWPNMLEDLQRLTISCVTCQRNQGGAYIVVDPSVNEHKRTKDKTGLP